MKVRSIVHYYGSKARMAPLIAEMLDYDNTDIYVEPFGGGCRVLLNKPRHKVECYNDYGEGICAVMRVISNPDTAGEFIERLGETEYSREEFIKAKELYDLCENDPEVTTRRAMIRLIKKTGGIKNDVLETLFPDTSLEITKRQAKKFGVELMEARPQLQVWIEQHPVEGKEVARLFDEWYRLFKLKQKQGFLPRSRDLYGRCIPDMELAVATYVTFIQSRDAMGETWSAFRYKNSDAYHNHMVGLYECAERMKGVQVFQIDALNFFCRGGENLQIAEWLNNPRVMMYLDPSYIRPEDEMEMLEAAGIDDVNSVPSLSEALAKEPENLGQLYATSFSYADQEEFLRRICDARCKMVVSNYDLALYDKYLTPERGWSRMEYHTTTGVGGK